MLANIDDILARWKEYCEEFYNHVVQKGPEIVAMIANEEPQHQYDKEPPIIKNEVIAAIRKLKNNRSPGTDNITAELLRAGGALAIDILHEINNMILESGEWSDRWAESIRC